MPTLHDRIQQLSDKKRALLEKTVLKKGLHVAVSETVIPIIKGDAAPLSFGQERLWILDRMEPGSPVYIRPLGMRFHGALQVEALAGSLNDIIARHEALRTNFTQTDGLPLQIVHPLWHLDLPFFDLRLLTNDMRGEETQRITAELLRRSFNLAHDRLVRASLLRLAEDEHLLLMAFHHIIFDGLSAGVFLRELQHFYEARSTGIPPSLPEPAVQYADFSVWQRKHFSGSIIEKGLDYWQSILKDVPPILELPVTRSRPLPHPERGARQQLTIEPSLTARLKETGRQEGASLFMMLLTLFATLLYRYSGQEHFIIGAPVANRTRKETEGLIGFFVNTLPLGMDLSGEPTFRELLRRVRDTAIEAYAHQNIPLERIVEQLNPERDPDHTPLFQVLFVMQGTALPETSFSGLELQLVEIDNGTAKFDLTLNLEESGNGLKGWIEYKEELFDRDTIERMSGHLLILLEAAVGNPDECISRLSILTGDERHRLLVEWNESGTDYPKNKCIHTLFEEQAERIPEAVAVVFEDQQLTYRELNSRANQLARLLVLLGVKPDVIVAIALERSIEMIVALLAIFKAGGAYVPLDPDYPMQRLAFMLEDSGARILLTQEILNRQFPFTAEITLCLDSEKKLIASQPDYNLLLSIASEHRAYVIYTSGSTGKPKGVLTTHGAISNRLMWMQTELKLNASDRILQKTPSSFDVSVWEFFWPLMFGACLVVARPGGHLDNLYMSELMRRESITTVHFVPPMLQFFLDMSETQPYTSLRQVICSGQELTVGNISRFFEVFPHCELYNLYGPTEASIDVTWFHCSAVETRLTTVPIGRPIANTQIYVLDRQLQPVPIGIPGELHIGGAGLARGYLNRPELTAEKFISDPFSDVPGARLYKTGDLARYRPDGNIEFLGRIDHQVEIRGFRIELGEIEAVLMQYSAVREVVAVVREDIPGDKRIVAYVVPKAGLQPTTSELRRFLATKLPEYMIPSLFVIIDSLPLTINGKIDRRALPAPDGARPELEDFYVAPRTPIEQKLADIWGELLGLEQVGVHDNFFELGGDSLLATQAILHICNRFLTEIPLRTLFEFPTVAGIAHYLIQHYPHNESNASLSGVLADLEFLSEEEAERLLE